MRNLDLIKQVTRRHAAVNEGAAADALDKAVNAIIRTLRGGHEARLPGLGTISPGIRWLFQQDRPELEAQRGKRQPK